MQMRIEPLNLSAVGSRIKPEINTTAISGGKKFGEVLSDALGEVNKLQNNASKASFDLATGNIQDISQVTIAAEKANIALQLTMQVRNKVIDAYQEIMRMQV